MTHISDVGSHQSIDPLQKSMLQTETPCAGVLPFIVYSSSMSKTSQFKTDCKNDIGYVAQQKQQKSKSF